MGGHTGTGFVFEYLLQLKWRVFNCKTLSDVTNPGFQQGLLRTREGFVSGHLFHMDFRVFTGKTLSDVESPMLAEVFCLTMSQARYFNGDPMVVGYFAELVVGQQQKGLLP